MQVDDQSAVSSAAEAPVTPEPAQSAPRELTEEETRAYLTRKDRSQSVADVIKPSEAKSDNAKQSEATKDEAKQPEADTGKQPGRGIDKRIKELKELLVATKDVRAAKREADPQLQQMREGILAKADNVRITGQPKPVQPEFQRVNPNEPPSLEEFQGLEDPWAAYEQANHSYLKGIREQVLSEIRREQAAEKEAQAWNDRATKAGVDPKALTEAATTYAALVEVGEMPAFSQAMVEALNDSTTEAGPAVALHLIENPSEVQRIAGLSPVAQVRELDKLAATLKGEAPAKQAPAVTVGRVVPKVSAASAPVPELGSGSASDPLADAVAANDFAAYEAAKRRKAG